MVDARVVTVDKRELIDESEKKEDVGDGEVLSSYTSRNWLLVIAVREVD